MKGIVFATGDDALRQEAEAYFTSMGHAFSNEIPVQRVPDWALVADLGMLAPLSMGLPNQDVTKHFGQTIALSSGGGFHARLQAARLGATGFLERPVTVADIFDLMEDHDRAGTGEVIKVMIVDDDPIAARVTGRQLELAGMRVLTVEDPSRALDGLREFQPDLAILDLYMPLCSGTELAQVIRQMSSFDSLPIIFLSSEGELAAQMNAVSIGGDDFVAKGTPAALMIPLIRSRAMRMRKLRSHRMTDGMTRLLTHTAFKAVLDHEAAAAGHSGEPLSMALLILDGLRSINDSYGTPMGDGAIKALARLLRHRTRPGDHMGRLGGVEFGLLMPATAQDAGIALVDGLRQTFAGLWHQSLCGRFQGSFSCGFARWRPGESGEALLMRAQAAVIRAKTEGRNRIVIDPHTKACP